MASLADLPTEILQIILQHLPPESLVAVLQTSKGLRHVANSPIIWRHLCQTRFQYWNASHSIASKFNGPLSDVDWRALFVKRITIEKLTGTLLDGIIKSQKLRIARVDQIAQFGYDAKEALLKEMNCPDDAEDVLARRYFATAVLERIQRQMAIEIWKDLAESKEVPIEIALGAFDLFVRTGPEVDLDVITNDVDLLAKSLLEAYPDFTELSTRMQALTLTSFLRERGFQGVSDESYGALHTSFIGLALSSPSHETLPLQSVAIYCALARRLGLDARPCNFIFHVYGIVYPPAHTSLDGEYIPNARDQECMYIDPFRSSEEVSKSFLEETLRERGVRPPEDRHLLTHASTRDIVGRTARNIAHSVERIRHNEFGRHGVLNGRRAWTTIHPDIDNSFYATLWASFYLDSLRSAVNVAHGVPMPSIISARRLQYLHYMQNHFQAHCLWDITLVHKYILPVLGGSQAARQMIETINTIRRADAEGKAIQHRDQSTSDVKFKVGQLFRHRRYFYEGVIIGWDTKCDATETWIEHMGVDRLARGVTQSFYNVLSCDKSFRYVAEENIEIITTSDHGDNNYEYPSDAMFQIAGRFFKRWDPESFSFVSNIRDEYPDD